LIETLEAKKLISENNIKFVEAIAYYSHPLYIELRNLIDKKEIGDIVSIDSLFGFKVKKIDPSSRLFNKKLGGGVILDLGCYPISFLMLFEKDTEKFIIERKKISYSSTNVDDFAEATINIKDEIKANIKISLKENLQNNCIIKGTKGQIFIPSPWLPEKNSYLEVQSDKGNYKKFFDIGKSVYANQIYNVSKYFNNEDDKNLFKIDFSLKCMNFLDRWIN
jgi:predicted dehydrogenase